MIKFLIIFTLILGLAIMVKKRRENIILESFNTNDIELSLYQKIPKKVLKKYDVNITLDSYQLNIFQVKAQSQLKRKVIGYMFPSDISYLKRLEKLYGLEFLIKQVYNDEQIALCDLFFIKTSINSKQFQDLNVKYPLLNFDKDRKKFINYYLPLAKMSNFVDQNNKEVINIIKTPNIVINNKVLMIDNDRSKIYNIHLDKVKYQKGNEINVNRKQKKKTALYECVKTEDLSVIPEHVTKQSCESEFDIAGNKKEFDMKWFRRCQDDSECKFFKISKNKINSKCSNGICGEPLKDNNIVLYYGRDKNDHAYYNDTEARMELDLRPIINL